MQLSDWFLTADERDNPATVLDTRHPGGEAWTIGNRVSVLVHGREYFARLHEVLRGLGRGDSVMFTDWRGDPGELLAGPGTEVATVLSAAARRGVAVRGLLWRSHTSALRFSARPNRDLGAEINAAGGEVLLDQRVRRFGSHHQKLVVTRTAQGDGDLAFVGGIDLCHGRGDDADHHGDPQALPMSPEYGDRPPWHDVQLEVEGPAVGDLEAVFRERWEDPSPLDAPWRLAVRRLRRHMEAAASELPPQQPDPPAAGTCAVQVLRTYPARLPAYPFAPKGERSVAASYAKALERARCLVYVEDQYLWSAQVAELFAKALRANPELRLVAVVPRYPEQDEGPLRPPALVGRQQALDVVLEAGGDRVEVYDVENHAGTPIYVHAKVCVIDDVWASVGSDNFNLRSWTHDSELSCAVVDEMLDERAPADPAGLGDGARTFARDLRLRLWREHLDSGDDDGLVDPDAGADVLRERARVLDAWHAGGKVGPRPAGRLRVHRSDTVSRRDQLWAKPLYSVFVDPDGRPRDGLRSRRW